METEKDTVIAEFLKEMNMKTSWDEIVLSEFVRLAEVEANKELKKQPLRRALERIKAITGRDEEELLDLSRSDFGHLVKASEFVDVEPETLFQEQETFFIGEVEYGYRKPSQLETREEISLQLAMLDAVEKKKSAFPGLLGILIRPVVRTPNPEGGEIVELKKFTIPEYELRVELFKQKLLTPFFIHALSRIIAGAKEIANDLASSMTKGNTTRRERRSKRK